MRPCEDNSRDVLMPKHIIRSQKVEILAPIDIVWAILIDLEKYPEWNPFTYRVDTTLNIGDPVELYVRMPKRGDRVQREVVREVNKPYTLAWGMNMGFDFLLKARRDQQLEIIDECRCSYQTWDAFSGLITPLVLALFADDMQNGFDGVATALKERAELMWLERD